MLKVPMIIQNLFFYSTKKEVKLTYEDAGKHINTIRFSDFETIVQLQLTQIYMEMLRSVDHEFCRLTHMNKKPCTSIRGCTKSIYKIVTL